MYENKNVCSKCGPCGKGTIIIIIIFQRGTMHILITSLSDANDNANCVWLMLMLRVIVWRCRSRSAGPALAGERWCRFSGPRVNIPAGGQDSCRHWHGPDIILNKLNKSISLNFQGLNTHLIPCTGAVQQQSKSWCLWGGVRLSVGLRTGWSGARESRVCQPWDYRSFRFCTDLPTSVSLQIVATSAKSKN